MDSARLFRSSCVALIATAMSFAIRSDIMGDFETVFSLTATEVGWIAGAAFWGFGVSILFGGPLCDVLGMRTLARLAAVGHIGGTVLTINGAGSTLCTGTNTDETLTNTGSRPITLTSDAGNNITLNSFAISIATGALEVNAQGSGDLIAGISAADEEIDTDGDVILRGTAIGATNGGIDITVTTDGGTLTVDSNAVADSDIVVIDGSNAEFDTITITQLLSDNNIDITTASADLIDINGAAGTATLNNVVLTAQATVFNYTLEESSTLTVVTNIDANTGNVTLVGTGTITLAVGAIVTTSGNVSVDSSAGGIRGNTDDGTADITTTGGNITLAANAGGIRGASGNNALDIDAAADAVITLTVDGTGDADVDYVAVEDVALSFTAPHSAAGDITFDSLATGTLTLNATTTGAGELTLLS